jgi:hypothetical protein
MLLNTKAKLMTPIILGILVIIVLSTGIPANAAPVLQLTPFPTPTPGTDGRIIYIVQANDTLLRISLIAGISIDEIKGLNNLTSDNLTIGQELLLGLGGPSQVTPTAGPSPTPTEILPTATALPGKGVLCVLLFNDHNGDSVRQEDEPSIPGGAISISNISGTIEKTVNTGDGLDHTCYQDLPEGQYNISVAIPDGYNPTTVGSYVLKLNAGDETYLNFGAQKNTKTQAEAPIPTGSGKSPVLGIIGGLFLFGGLVLVLFARQLMKGK